MGNINLKIPPTKDQLSAMNVTRTFFCVPSFIGSAYIVVHVLKNKERRKKLVKTRILLCMSVMDILYTTATFANFGLPPLPHLRRGLEEELPYEQGSGSYAMCMAIGFFTQGGRLSSIIYNCSLTTYYLFMIRYMWRERKIKQAVEPYLHVFPLLLGWGTAIAGLPLQLYNPTPTGCDIDSFPPGCFGDPELCTRATNAAIYLRWFFFLPLWSAVVFLIVAMTLIYLRIRRVENNTNKHSTVLNILRESRKNNGNTNSLSVFQRSSAKIGINAAITTTTSEPQQNEDTYEKRTSNRNSNLAASAVAKRREKSRNFAKQALLYCVAFFISWICFSIMGVFLWATGSPRYVILLFLSNVLAPLQGFWNAVVYIRPQYLSQRRKQEREQQQQQHRSQRSGGGAFSSDPLQSNVNSNNTLSSQEEMIVLEESHLASSSPPPNTSNNERRGSSGSLFGGNNRSSFFNRRGSKFFALSNAIWKECDDSEELLLMMSNDEEVVEEEINDKVVAPLQKKQGGEEESPKLDVEQDLQNGAQDVDDNK